MKRYVKQGKSARVFILSIVAACLLFACSKQSAPPPKRGERKKKFFRQQRNVIEEILKKGISSGKFRECNTQEVAKVIFSLVRGFIVSLVIEPDALFSPEECGNLILTGLLKKR